MNNKRRRTIGVTTCLFVVFISGICTSAIEQTTVAMDRQKESGAVDIIVQILDDSYIAKEHVVTLTYQKASELDLLIEIISKRLQDATSREEIKTSYREAISQLQTLGLIIYGQETEKILHVWERKTSMQFRENEGPLHLHGIHLNALCCLAGDTTITRFAGFRTITLLRVGLWLYHLGFSWLFMDLLLMTSLFIDSVKPLSIGHRILFGEFGIPSERLADGWIVTCGVTGVRKTTGSMRGMLGCNSVTEYTGALGFSGLKIIHEQGAKTFFLGSALFVCIQE